MCFLCHPFPLGHKKAQHPSNANKYKKVCCSNGKEQGERSLGISCCLYPGLFSSNQSLNRKQMPSINQEYSKKTYLHWNQLWKSRLDKETLRNSTLRLCTQEATATMRDESRVGAGTYKKEPSLQSCLKNTVCDLERDAFKLIQETQEEHSS